MISEETIKKVLKEMQEKSDEKFVSKCFIEQSDHIKETILQLMGCPPSRRSNRWEYRTLEDCDILKAMGIDPDVDNA